MAKFDKKLKNILLKRGLLTDEDASTAQSEAEEQGKGLATVVLDKGFVDEKDLIAAVAKEMNVPPIDVSKVDVDVFLTGVNALGINALGDGSNLIAAYANARLDQVKP